MSRCTILAVRSSWRPSVPFLPKQTAETTDIIIKTLKIFLNLILISLKNCSVNKTPLKTKCYTKIEVLVKFLEAEPDIIPDTAGPLIILHF